MLVGVFCLLCANRTDHFYVRGGSSALAHCEPCENALQHADRWGFTAGALAPLLLLALLHQLRRVVTCAPTDDPAKKPTDDVTSKRSPWLRVIKAGGRSLNRLLGTKLKLLISFFQIASQVPLR